MKPKRTTQKKKRWIEDLKTCMQIQAQLIANIYNAEQVSLDGMGLADLLGISWRHLCPNKRPPWVQDQKLFILS